MYNIEAIYAIIITHCLRTGDNIQEKFDALTNFTQITSIMRKHLFDFIYEYCISADNSPSEFSYAQTPRLQPIIYKLVDATKFFYRNTDTIKYKSMLKAKADIAELDLKLRRDVMTIEIETKSLNKHVSILDREKEEVIELFNKGRINHQARDTELTQIRNKLFEIREKILENDEAIKELTKKHQEQSRKLEDNTRISYDSAPGSDAVIENFNVTQLQLMTDEVNKKVKPSIIQEILSRQQTKSNGPIMNHQIFSTIVSRLGTEDHEILEKIMMFYNESLTKSNYDQSVHKIALSDFVDNSRKFRDW